MCVQNGAMHHWRTNPDNPAHVVFVVLGAERSDDDAAAIPGSGAAAEPSP